MVGAPSPCYIFHADHVCIILIMLGIVCFTLCGKDVLTVPASDVLLPFVLMLGKSTSTHATVFEHQCVTD